MPRSLSTICYKRRVSPVMGEIILELLYKSQGKKLPDTEIASTKGILLEQVVSSESQSAKSGWKKSRLPSFDLKKNNSLTKSLSIGKTWIIIPSNQSSSRPQRRGRLPAFAKASARQAMVAARVPASGKRIPILIEAGLGFGSGEHETTRLCLELLETIRPTHNSDSFLDVGTGSGILALGAWKKGFSKVVGLDCDKNALRNAQQNARLNDASMTIRWKYEDVSKWKSPFTFQVIAANLLSSILIQQSDRISSWLQKNGFLIISGFFRKEVANLKKEFSKYHIHTLKEVRKGKWCALLLKKTLRKRKLLSGR